jgi:hypothetical protein
MLSWAGRERKTARVRKLLTIILLVALIGFVNYPVQLPHVEASPAIVYSEPSDGVVHDSEGVSGFAAFMIVGDDDGNHYTRGFVKFSLSGVSGTLSSARLHLYVMSSLFDSTLDSTSPLANPGLGECRVFHIDDYGDLESSDFAASSIGNDPGVLISGTETPEVGYISIDITAAMEDDLDHGRPFTTFMIKLSTNTDGDWGSDQWYFGSSESGTGMDPYIEYLLASPLPWTQVNSDGFDGDAGNIFVQDMEEFNGYIYAVTFNSNTGAEVWRSEDGTVWNKIGDDGFGDPNNHAGRLRIFKEELYLITSNRATGVEVWRSSDGASWSQVGGDGFGDPNNIVGYPIVGGNYLYVATRNKVTGVKVFRSSDGASWSQINENGFGDLNNKLPWLRFIFKNHLYVATLNEVTGVEVWRLDELVLQPDFQLNASPSSLTVGRGGSQTSTINVLSLNSFSSPVELSYSWFGGAPSDVAVNLPGPVTPPPDDAGTSTLQVSAGGAATIGTFTLRVTGTSGAISHSMDVSVEITEAATTTAETTTTEATTTTTAETTTTGTTATTETSGTVTTPTPTITPLVPGCIIATAAYGSELSGEVQFLRSFRDDKVMGTFAGSAFMKAFNAFYYSFSPQVARFISGSPTLRALTRILLYPLMGALHLSYTVFNALSFTPELAVVAAGFTVSTLLGVFYLFPIAAIMLVVAKRKGCTIKTGGIWWIALAGLISLSALAIGGAVEHVGITMFSSSLFVVSTIATTGIALATRAVKRL